MSDQPKPEWQTQAVDPQASPVPLAGQPDYEDVRAVLFAKRAELEQVGLSGANWFLWIGGLSLVNPAILHFGGNVQFVVGLAATLFVDSIARHMGDRQPEMATAFTAVAIFFDLLIAGLVAGTAWLARKRYLWIYGIGMLLYVLDGLVFLMFGDLMSVAFHGFALYGMWSGFQAFRNLGHLEAADEQIRTFGSQF